MKNIFVHGLSAYEIIHKVDYIPNEPVKYKSRNLTSSFGGNAALAALTVTKLTGNAYLSSIIGNDSFGNILFEKLTNEKINLKFVKLLDNFNTSVSSIFIDKDGERLVMNYRDNSVIKENFDYNYNYFDGFLFDTRHLSSSLQILKKINSINKPKLLDAEENTSLEIINLCTHVAFSYQGICSFTGIDDIEESLKKINQLSKSQIFVTNGSEGCFFLKNNKLVNVPTNKINPVDTLGAGDVWHGALILMLSHNYNIETCIKYANTAATIKCTKFDKIKSIPTHSEIIKNFSYDLFA